MRWVEAGGLVVIPKLQEEYFVANGRVVNITVQYYAKWLTLRFVRDIEDAYNHPTA
jgi:hypothetical protein